MHQMVNLLKGHERSRSHRYEEKKNGAASETYVSNHFWYDFFILQIELLKKN